jgi:hypothetical protein
MARPHHLVGVCVVGSVLLAAGCSSGSNAPPVASVTTTQTSPATHANTSRRSSSGSSTAGPSPSSGWPDKHRSNPTRPTVGEQSNPRRKDASNTDSNDPMRGFTAEEVQQIRDAFDIDPAATVNLLAQGQAQAAFAQAASLSGQYVDEFRNTVFDPNLERATGRTDSGTGYLLRTGSFGRRSSWG